MKLLIIFCFFTLISCKDSQETLSSLKPRNNVSFSVGYRAYVSCTGVYYDHKYKEDLFYFVDEYTENQIKVFKPNGTLLDSIPLNKVSTIQFRGISFVSRDTILITGTSVEVINRKGEIINRINVDNALQKISNVQYQMLVYDSQFNEDPNNLYLFMGFFKYRDVPNDMSDYEKFITAFHKSDYYEPNLLRITDYCTPKYGLSFSPTNIKEYFFKQPFNTTEIRATKTLNGNLFIKSDFSNQIIEIELPSFEIKRKIKITSTYASKIGMKPLPLESSLDGKEELEYRYKNNIISNILYNKKNNHYYVLISLATNDEKLISEKKNKDVLLIEYDEDFNKISETKLLSKDYRGSYTRIANGKIYILKYTDDESKMEYSIFE